MHTRDMQNVCLQTYRNNGVREKVAYLLKKMQTSRVNKSRIQDCEIIKALFSYEHEYRGGGGGGGGGAGGDSNLH